MPGSRVLKTQILNARQPRNLPEICIRGHKGQNSTGTRCRGFLALESRCRAYLSPFLDVVFFGLGISMLWLFGLGISMSWYVCLHGLVFVFPKKMSK